MKTKNSLIYYDEVLKRLKKITKTQHSKYQR